ncbi:hypothetical protein XPA_006372 [Xanthoria parietina]
MSKLEQRRARMSRLDAHGNNDVCFMVYRRFAWLHSQVLKFLPDMMWGEELSRDPNQIDGRGPFPRPPFPTKDDFFARPGRYLSQLIAQQLARYDEMILSMGSLAQTPPPRAGHYQSIREYLYHGPPIYMNHFEVPRRRWAQYEEAVRQILKDNNASHWLDAPLERGWTKTLLRGRSRWEHDTSEHDGPSGHLQLATIGAIFFWILHVTSALGFILADHASASDDYFLERM